MNDMLRSGVMVLFAGMLALGVGLVVFTPVPWVWQRWAPAVPFQLSGIQGTLWRGQAVLGPQRAPQQVRLHWQFRPSAIWQRELAWQLNLRNAHTDVQIDWQWQPKNQHVQIQGYAQMMQLEPWLYPQPIAIQGQLHVPHLALHWQPHLAWLSAQGEFSLNSAQMQFNWLDGQRYETETLDVMAHFERDADDQTHFKLGHRNEPITFITALLQPEGLLRFQLLSPVRDWVPFYVPGGSTLVLDAEIPIHQWYPL